MFSRQKLILSLITISELMVIGLNQLNSESHYQSGQLENTVSQCQLLLNQLNRDGMDKTDNQYLLINLDADLRNDIPMD